MHCGSFFQNVVFLQSQICTNIDCKGGQLRLPFERYMSVHRAILLAAANFKEHNKDVNDRLNPFNAVFAWNNRRSCYVIKELLKQKSRHNGHWDITVITIEGKVCFIYLFICLSIYLSIYSFQAHYCYFYRKKFLTTFLRIHYSTHASSVFLAYSPLSFMISFVFRAVSILLI